MPTIQEPEGWEGERSNTAEPSPEFRLMQLLLAIS